MKNNTKYTVCKKKIESIIDKMELPKITLNSEEVTSKTKHILNAFKCMICKGIPVAPV